MDKLVNKNPTPNGSEAARPRVGQWKNKDANVSAESTNPVSIAPPSIIRTRCSVMNVIRSSDATIFLTCANEKMFASRLVAN